MLSKHILKWTGKLHSPGHIRNLQWYQKRTLNGEQNLQSIKQKNIKQKKRQSCCSSPCLKVDRDTSLVWPLEKEINHRIS